MQPRTFLPFFAPITCEPWHSLRTAWLTIMRERSCIGTTDGESIVDYRTTYLRCSTLHAALEVRGCSRVEMAELCVVLSKLERSTDHVGIRVGQNLRSNAPFETMPTNSPMGHIAFLVLSSGTQKIFCSHTKQTPPTFTFINYPTWPSLAIKRAAVKGTAASIGKGVVLQHIILVDRHTITGCLGSAATTL